MRIIGGTYKSRIIDFPKNRLTRPMTDRTKETLFNILGGLVVGKQVLDLYSGSGSIGLECLSRGALHVDFVDKAPWAVKTIEKNIASLKLESKAEVHQEDIFKQIDLFKKQKRFFSMVFIDPPFDKGLVQKTLSHLDESGILTPFAHVVVGHTLREKADGPFKNLALTRIKKIGQAQLTFLFRLEAENAETKSYLSGEF